MQDRTNSKWVIQNPKSRQLQSVLHEPDGNKVTWFIPGTIGDNRAMTFATEKKAQEFLKHFSSVAPAAFEGAQVIELSRVGSNSLVPGKVAEDHLKKLMVLKGIRVNGEGTVVPALVGYFVDGMSRPEVLSKLAINVDLFRRKVGDMDRTNDAVVDILPFYPTKKVDLSLVPGEVDRGLLFRLMALKGIRVEAQSTVVPGLISYFVEGLPRAEVPKVTGIAQPLLWRKIQDMDKMNAEIVDLLQYYERPTK